MALQKCFVSTLWSGPAPDGMTVFGRDSSCWSQGFTCTMNGGAGAQEAYFNDFFTLICFAVFGYSGDSA